MEIKLSYSELQNIVATHARNKGFDNVKASDVCINNDCATIEILNDKKPYENIEFPLCTRVNNEMHPRCMNLLDQKYCNRLGGSC
jgi:hypothetical protein